MLALFPLRQVVPGQRVLMSRQPVPLSRQSAPSPRQTALPHRQVVSRQPALTPREIVLSPNRQVVPKQVVARWRTLTPRHSVSLKQSALTPREIALFIPMTPGASRQAARARVNNPQGFHRDNSLEYPNSKWITNLSSKPLTQVHGSVLAKGPNFAISPRHPPNLECITAIESVCTNLGHQDAEELRADINRDLRSFCSQT